MRNFWLIAKQEYRRAVVRRSFVILTAAIPLGLAALIAVAVVVERMGDDKRPIGYVDLSGTIDLGLYAALPEAGDRTQIQAFPDEETARAALESGQIQAFFVLPPNYPQTLHTELYYLEEPPEAWGAFGDLVRINLMAGLPAEVQRRLLEGPDITVHDLVSGREFSESSIANIILPIAVTFILYFSTMMSAGQMLGVVTTEKENRTMEIMVTSVTPGQLIGGKSAGLMAAALTQLAIYVVAAVVGLIAAAPYVPELQRLVVPWDYIGLIIPFFLVTYALIAAVMITIGSAVTEIDQGQQLAGLLNFLFMAPLFLMPLLFENPGHPLVVFLTFFPTSSFMTVSLRWALGSVPLWQIGVGWGLLAATAGVMLWIAPRVFRAGMLHYGQPLNFKAALAALRG